MKAIFEQWLDKWVPTEQHDLRNIFESEAQDLTVLRKSFAKDLQSIIDPFLLKFNPKSNCCYLNAATCASAVAEVDYVEGLIEVKLFGGLKTQTTVHAWNRYKDFFFDLTPIRGLWGVIDAPKYFKFFCLPHDELQLKKNEIERLGRWTVALDCNRVRIAEHRQAGMN